MRRAGLLLAMTALGVVLTVGAAGAAQGSAEAPPRDPPETSIVKVTGGRTERLQGGRLGSYCWTRAGGLTCVDQPKPDFPRRAVGVGAGREIRARVFGPEKPDALKLWAYRGVDGDGFPLGQRRPVRSSLRRVVEDGRTVAWDAVFRVGSPGRDYYLDLFGVWGDGTEARRDASWAFHLETERRR